MQQSRVHVNGLPGSGWTARRTHDALRPKIRNTTEFHVFCLEGLFSFFLSPHRSLWDLLNSQPELNLARSTAEAES